METFNYQDYALKNLFNNKKRLFKLVKLTKKEVDIFISFNQTVLYDNGLKWTNGGWSDVIIYDIEEDENTRLVCEVSCGISDEGGSRKDSWTVYYNRVTKKFEG